MLFRSDFKQFVLGTLFYRFISENFADYIKGGDDSIDYASLPDSVITPEIKDDAVKTKGYFIYPSQLFVNVVKTANTNPNLNTDLKAIFDSIESSANGAGILGTGFSDCDSCDRHAGRHLHCGKKAVHTAESGCLHRDTDDRQNRGACEYAC